MKLFGFTFNRTESLIVWVVIAIGLIIFWRWARTKSARLATDSAIDRGIAEGLEAGEALSYEDSQFTGWANTLQTAMEGAGTDENTIYNVFRKLQHTTDLLYLIKKFGHRDKKNMIGRVKGTWDLSQWITDEMDAEELDKLNKILIDKTIRYQF